MTFLIAAGSLKTPGYYSSHVLLLPLLLLLLLDGEWICNEQSEERFEQYFFHFSWRELTHYKCSTVCDGIIFQLRIFSSHFAVLCSNTRIYRNVYECVMILLLCSKFSCSRIIILFSCGAIFTVLKEKVYIQNFHIVVLRPPLGHFPNGLLHVWYCILYFVFCEVLTVLEL